ncbi:MAG: hypothetical protein HYY81_11030 [Deltaproteobacteria bacterium]|nr:hypothetical protein [Deltaproteobacteria bacterium]
MLDSKTNPAQENVWVKSTCFMCWNTCGIRVNRIDGLIVKIEGDPECPQNWGKTCARQDRGRSGMPAELGQDLRQGKLGTHVALRSASRPFPDAANESGERVRR